jgi:hypothetical protein
LVDEDAEMVAFKAPLRSEQGESKPPNTAFIARDRACQKANMHLEMTTPQPAISSLPMAARHPSGATAASVASRQGCVPTPRPPETSAFPGAFAIGGVSDVRDELANNNSILGNPTNAPTNLTEPVTAQLVNNTEADYHYLQEQLQRQQQQLEEVQRRQENIVVGQVLRVENNEMDEEEAGVEGSNKASPSSNSLKRKVAIAIALILVVVAIIVSSVVTTSLSKSPTSAVSPDLIQLLSSVSPDGGTALRTSSTPQNTALIWLANNTNLETYSAEKKIQRYILAVLYYSTSGDNWNRNTAWITDVDECDWYNLADTSFCDVNGTVVELDFYDLDTEIGNNLVGTIPNELALLSNSLEELTLANNSLTGFIPSEVGRLTQLTSLSLLGNSLRGTIPNEITSLTLLSPLVFGFLLQMLPCFTLMCACHFSF